MPLRCAFSLLSWLGEHEGAGARNGAGGSRGKHPSSKVWLRRLTSDWVLVWSGQVRSDAFMGSGQEFMHFLSLSVHNITSISPSLLYLPTWSDGETRDGVGGAAKSKGARAAVVSPKNSRAQIPDSNLEHKNRRP